MLAFIEGSMEREFVNRNFKYVRVVPVSNGITWTTERLCLQIVTAFKAFDRQVETIVWLDREGRVEPSDAICVAIRNALVGAGAMPDDVHVLVNDRTAENVFLADEAMIRSHFEHPDYSYVAEGLNGKVVVKSMYRAMDQHYREMQHGVALLKKMQLANSAERSPCVAAFLQTFDRDCWWIRRPN